MYFMFFFFLSRRLPPIYNRTDTLLPVPTLFRSLAVDEDTHQQREWQRQHQRHFDDGGAALLARQGKVCLANVADAPRKYAGTGHAARMARANESGVEKTRRRDRKSTRLNSSH